ncbi:MAG: hypothetical protein COA69_07110 [Robiginitomaculum sp.]|nr:MAG: hypothetical protein COA69_07110 [Robiginitomaculum sp.]
MTLIRLSNICLNFLTNVSIPIRNIYYLMLYAWGKFTPGALVDVGQDISPDLPNLFAKVLNQSTKRLLRRGLGQGYVGYTDETRCPRGKLRMDLIAKRQTLLRGFAVCDMDEFTLDILHNQILKSTLRKLSSCKDVQQSLRHELRLTLKRFANVTDIRVSGSVFARVQLSRNLAHYGLPLKISEFVFHSLMPDELGSGNKFKNILENEKQMAAIFEAFLLNFYKLESQNFEVGSQRLQWDAVSQNSAHLNFLPGMQTDITLKGTKSNAGRIIVSDAKYYKEALTKGRFGKKTVRSAHLYQLSTYLIHTQSKNPDAVVSGLLIYPTSGDCLSLDYTIMGFPVKIVSVNLNQAWHDIHEELLGFI